MGAIEGLYHEPFGWDSPYFGDDTLWSQTGRYPRDPMQGQQVYIKATTWPTRPGQSVWITWTKNGVAQPDIGALWEFNSGDNSYWQAALPALDRGDQVEYYVWAQFAPKKFANIGPLAFAVTSWSNATSVTGFQDHGTSIDVSVGDSAGDFHPVIRFAFSAPDAFRLQLAPSGGGLSIGGQNCYTVADSADVLRVSTADLVLEIQKNPYRLSIFESDGSTLIAREQDPAVYPNMAWASDGKGVITRICDHYVAAESERFYGFGERYDYFDQRGRDVWIYAVNDYLSQRGDDKTYLAVPFFVNSGGYGVYIATTALSIFNVDTYGSASSLRDMSYGANLSSAEVSGMLGFTAATSAGLNSTLEYHFFAGKPKSVLDRFTSVTARPRLPPKWAFGLWMSAHGWNTQQLVSQTLDTAEELSIPATVLVLEQWSDEATFYVWWGAEYSPVPGGQALTYSSFTFPPAPAGRWADPRAMVADAHRRGVRVVLWQIPVLKEDFSTNPSNPPPQHLADKAYAVTQGLVVDDGTSGQYRIGTGQWFGDSMVPDWTNPGAVEWWMSKRKYLVEEVGVDAFKCDGGEIIFGRSLRFADGRSGDVMHNGYPGSYIGAYGAFLHSVHGEDYTLFSRAGTAGAQALSIYWAGDQESSFEAFNEALRAGLTAGQSGIAFWGWDLAGFSGPIPPCELYLRATAMAAFCPIMQFHSEQDAFQERSPWNIAAQHASDPLAGRVVEVFRSFANVRMNLLPYIYSEAKRSSDTGCPLMRAMCVEFPEDPATLSLETQYMFGDQLLVAPVLTQGATSVEVHVPAGEWWDLWSTARFTGPAPHAYDAPIERLPVLARPGAILPLNVDGSFEIGPGVGNSVTDYANLTFRVYPEGSATYAFYDDFTRATQKIHASASWDARSVTIALPALSVPVAVQVIVTAPVSVAFNRAELQQAGASGDLVAGQAGWFWDPVLQATIVRLPSGSAGSLVLSGVDKAAYGAEYASGLGTTVNTNHPGYTGTGFVDHFDTAGNSLSFGVNVDAAAGYALRVRYANGLGALATRDLYVDGSKAGTLNMPPLVSWDVWAEASLVTSLDAGPHTIELLFSSDNATAINVDSLTVGRGVTQQ
jgi:alpha-glucosidase (family GH31 glycosyl hydrolase)